MKKIILGFCVVSLVLSCKDSVVEKPQKKIDEDVMISILYDLSLVEAIKSQPVLVVKNAVNSSQFIYKKYKIDSIQFAQNNKYYAADVENYKKMFDKVKQKLDFEIKKTEAIMKKKGEQVAPNISSSSFNENIPLVK